MIDQRKIQQLKESPHAQTVIDWFNEEISKMNSISTHKDWADVLGKQYAEKILKELIQRIDNKPVKEKLMNQYR
jgi:hypothetical protein